jgi:hypothetical protein
MTNDHQPALTAMLASAGPLALLIFGAAARSGLLGA